MEPRPGESAVSVQTEEITLTCADGVFLRGTVYRQPLSRRAIVIASALGTPREFYANFASFFAEKGYTVVCFDYRGVGSSESGAQPRLADWGRLDIDAAIKVTRRNFQPEKLFLVGHNCGGQLFGLAESSAHLDGVVLASAGLPHWRLSRFPHNIGQLAIGATAEIASRLAPVYPAKTLGWARVNVPSAVMADWARWMRQPDNLFNPRFGLDTGLYASLAVPIIAFGASDDGVMPMTAIVNLLKRFPKAKITRKSLNTEALQLGAIGHHGFFHFKMKDSLWRYLLKWMEIEASRRLAPKRNAA